MSQSIYQIEHLKHCYGEQTVLQIEKLSIEQGSMVGLVGPNGSGKSTFLRLLALAEKPSQGDLCFNGSRKNSSDSQRFKVTLLTQEPYLLKRSVFENIFYGLKIRGESLNCEQRIRQALSWVGLSPGDFARRQWYELSGGEAQRVALAARLILEPKVLLLDEPTASVDFSSARLIRDASLKAQKEWGTTLVIASHDWSWLHEVCDEVLHFFRGHIIGSSIENIILGPWCQKSNNQWEKKLQNGQCIFVPPLIRENAVVVISPTAISVTPQIPNDSSMDNILEGTLSRLSLEKRTGDILATITVEDLVFTAKLAFPQTQGAPFYPGQRVWIAFDSNSIKWF